MSKIEDGGAAFPCEGGCDSGLHPDPGMSLRDWFAGQVLVGLLASERPDFHIPSKEKAAITAYEYADAMLAARKEGGAHQTCQHSSPSTMRLRKWIGS
jgi:hypothetical protein